MRRISTNDCLKQKENQSINLWITLISFESIVRNSDFNILNYCDILNSFSIEIALDTMHLLEP